MSKEKYIIFTDLDGTLLDHHTYTFAPAQPALNFLKENNVPLILVSSKTRTEILGYQEQLDIKNMPFIVENGAAVFSPPNYFDSGSQSEVMHGLICHRFGHSYDELHAILLEISKKHNYEIRGFHTANKLEIMQATGLDEKAADYAMLREFSIPLFYDDSAQNILNQELDTYNLTLLYGGRFMHLLGNANKGMAMNYIIDRYRLKYPECEIRSVALGDSPNDFDMIRAADFGILVKRHDGTYAALPDDCDAMLAKGIGPNGWNQAVIDVLNI